jgi:hypothetical protein
MVMGRNKLRSARSPSSVMVIIMLITMLVWPCSASVYAAAPETENTDLYAVAEGIVAWGKDTAGSGGALLSGDFLTYAGSSAGDWFPFGLGRLGVADDYEAYLLALRDAIASKYRDEGKLDPLKATEWHRISLAMLAAGGDPTRAGRAENGENIDLIADGVYDRGRVESLDAQGLNGLIWGLITLDALRYKTPADAFSSRGDIVSALLASRLDDGSFSLDGDAGSVDITAMAVTALAPYYNSEERFAQGTAAGDKKSGGGNDNAENEGLSARVAVDAALEWLSTQQLDEGDFSAWGDPNSESASQVIVALCALGIDPETDERFIKGDRSAVDGLLKYRVEDGGFAHAADEEGALKSSSMASEQALYAVTALLRLRNGRRSLFDFRPEMPGEIKSRIASLEEGIASLPDDAGAADVETVRALFEEYREVPVEERSSVYGYRRLSDAMEALGLSNDSEALSGYMELNDGGAGTIIDVRTGEVRSAGRTGTLRAVVIAVVIAACVVALTLWFFVGRRKRRRANEYHGR